MNPSVQYSRRSNRRKQAYRPIFEILESREVLSAGYTQINLASDVPGVARVLAPTMVNPWGMSFSPTGPFWFAEQGTGLSDVLDGRGQIIPLVVTVPGPGLSAGTPTGTVFFGGDGFTISHGGANRSSRFLFANEDGTISGWNSFAHPTRGIVAVDNSALGASYKGLAIATDPDGHSFLYAADFGRGAIDVFDDRFRPVVRPGAFQDPNLPAGFAPFSVQTIGDQVFVAYAQQDSDEPGEEVTGAGLGFVDVYDISGNLVRRFASQGVLDAPWGMTMAPASFGQFGGDLLVGNNGDGHISAFDPNTGEFLGQLQDDFGNPIAIPELWGLTFGNGYAGGDVNTLFFTAGLDDEQHGLFGAIQSPAMSGMDTGGQLGGYDPTAPGEPSDYPLPPISGPTIRFSDDWTPHATSVLLPLADSSLALIPTLTFVAQPRSNEPATASDTSVIAASFDRFNATNVLASSEIVVLPAVDESQPLAAIPNNALALNSFLDLTSSANAVERTPSQETTNSTARQENANPGTAAPAQMFVAPMPAESRADTLRSPVPSGSTNGFADAEVAPDGRDFWTTLVKGLLFAFTITLVCAFPERWRRLQRSGDEMVNNVTGTEHPTLLSDPFPKQGNV